MCSIFFLLENLMNDTCSKLEYEDHHIIQQPIRNKIKSHY
jgi:hypothetical protein